MINREGDVRDANAFMSADRHRLMTSVGRRELLRPRSFPPA